MSHGEDRAAVKSHWIIADVPEPRQPRSPRDGPNPRAPAVTATCLNVKLSSEMFVIRFIASASMLADGRNSTILWLRRSIDLFYQQIVLHIATWTRVSGDSQLLRV